MPSISTRPFSANGISYRPPATPVVVVCVDGSAEEYFNASLALAQMPNLTRIIVEGYRGLVRSALPSFTNVNNASIVTGVPPARHGSCGNFFYDEKIGAEVMMNSAAYLRAETLLASAARAGRRVAVVTAKEKLRDILAKDLQGIAFSAEKADQAKKESHGLDRIEELVGSPKPEIYSADASLFVLRAGVALIRKGLADLLYLSLTDYLQHTFAPETRTSLDFYEAMDREWGNLLSAGALLGLTADHGMNAKVDASGNPRVLYLEEMLESEFGPGFRVICPITDPYVKHHGALGSYAVVHLTDKSQTTRVGHWLSRLSGVTEVHDKPSAVRLLEQPEDRAGDIAVLSGRDVVLGRRPAYHDLSALDGTLRSHGGRYEEMVSMFISRPLSEAYRRKAAGDPRNFQIFDFTINGTS